MLDKEVRACSAEIFQPLPSRSPVVPIRGHLRRPLGSRVGQQQWLARDRPTTLVLNLPTSQALLTEVAATADRKLTLPGLGADTCFQRVPFQRTMRLCSVVRLSDRPTARALVVEVAATPVRSSPGPGLGLGTRAHLVPAYVRQDRVADVRCRRVVQRP